MKARRQGNILNLGRIVNGGANLGFPPELRDKHLYVCGGTGTGKSKLLEGLIQQDILKWPQSKCGLLLLDPHGKLYDDLIKWLAWHDIKRPVIPIDLRQDEWVVSYNILRKRKTEPAVVVDNIVDAIAHVWGVSGTDQTPLLARWAGNVISTLYEKGHTLAEAAFLLDRIVKETREAMSQGLLDTAQLIPNLPLKEEALVMQVARHQVQE